MGSENGKPISRRFAPADSSVGIVAIVVSMSGYTAAMKVIISICFLALSSSNVCASVTRIGSGMIRGQTRIASDASKRVRETRSDFLGLAGIHGSPDCFEHLHVL